MPSPRNYYPYTRRFALGLVLSAGLTAVAVSPTLAQTQMQESAVAPETHPPGDIPDDQQFIVYTAPQGASLKVPEGWARRDTPDGATFSDRYGRIELAIRPFTGSLTPAAVRADQVSRLEKTRRAVKIVSVETTKLPAGAAVRIVFTENSDPNPVTHKQIRLESECILVAHGDRLAELTFSAPQGADNVDQWRLMSRSFTWK